MEIRIIASAYAQARGEGSIPQESEDPLAFLIIFALIAVFAAFKRSNEEGMKTLGFCVFAALLVAFIPAIGNIVIGILGLIIAWAIIRSFK